MTIKNEKEYNVSLEQLDLFRKAMKEFLKEKAMLEAKFQAVRSQAQTLEEELTDYEYKLVYPEEER